MSKAMSAILEDYEGAIFLCEKRIKGLFDRLSRSEVAPAKAGTLSSCMRALLVPMGSYEGVMDFMEKKMMKGDFDLAESDEALVNFLVETFEALEKEGELIGAEQLGKVLGKVVEAVDAVDAAGAVGKQKLH